MTETVVTADQNAEAIAALAESRTGEMHTLVDRILSFIREHSKTTVAELADVFAMDQAQVERLATVLEESGLITMRYALLHPGRTELLAVRKKQVPGAAKPVLTALQQTAESREHDFELREMIKGVDLDMQESQQAMTALERDVLTKLARIEKVLGEIERRERTASQSDIDFLLKEADALELMRRDMMFHLKVFNARIGSVGGRIRRVKHAVHKGPLHGLMGLLANPFKHGKKDALLNWTIEQAKQAKQVKK